MSLSTIKKRWIVLFTVIIGSLSLGGCFHGKGHHKGEMMFEYLSWKLDFSDEQQVLLEDVKTEMMKARQSMKEQRKQDKASFIALINNETLDTEAAMALFDKKHQAIEAHAPAVLEKVAVLHATLTPEQKEKIVEKIEHMGKKYE